jgi:hypothetical protein
VLAEHDVPQTAGAALPDPDRPLLVNARQGLGAERPGPVGDLDADAEAGPRRRAHVSNVVRADDLVIAVCDNAHEHLPAVSRPPVLHSDSPTS